MRHGRVSRWDRLVGRYPKLPDLLSIIGIIIAMGLGMALLLWIATASITGLG